MTHRSLIAITLLMCLTQFVAADDLSTDQERLQGEWQVTGLRVRGQDIGIENLADGSYIFSDSRFQVTGALRCGGNMKLNTLVTPKQIDLEAVDGDASGKTFKGVYRFDGARLILCLGEARPEGFSGDGEAGLLVLERRQRQE